MTTLDPGRPFEGRTALVTGSGRNIGRAIALAFARGGANVVLNGHRDGAALDRVADEIRAVGGNAIAVLADVGDPDAVRSMVDRAGEAFGGVDILISNVSLRLHTPFLDIGLDEWRQIMNTNLDAAFYLMRATLPGMKARGWGRIVTISGVDGFAVFPDRAHNVTCKAGVFALAKAVAVEFGPFGITANTVAPGIIDTERDLEQYPQYRNGYDGVIKDIPVRRVGKVEEIADACTYLASAGFVTGQVLHVNGGEWLF